MPAKDDAVVSLSPDPLPLTPLPGTLLRLQVDKKNLGSESTGKNGHKFGIIWKPDGQKFALGSRDAIVTLVSRVGVEPRVFEFSGGNVGVRDLSDPDIEPRDAPRLACPNKDTITVTVALP